MVRACAKIRKTTFTDLDILPRNDTIAKVTPNDHDLLFQGKK